jgi:hypothetical protein
MQFLLVTVFDISQTDEFVGEAVAEAKRQDIAAGVGWTR